MLGNFLSCITFVKYRFQFQEGIGISLETLQWERASSRDDRTPHVFSRVAAGFLRHDGNSGSLSCWPREVQSAFEFLGGAGDCSRVTAGQIGLI